MNIRAIFLSLRPHHWTKNLLVFLPLMASHQILNVLVLQLTIVVFACLCLVASAGYIINDFFDIKNDLEHPHKKSRPLASGKIVQSQLLSLSLVLAIAGLWIGWEVNLSTFYVLLAYILLSITYTLFLKKIFFVDVLCLAVFFILRIIAGHEASSIKYSHWLFSFSFLFFFSLACLKRCAELIRLKRDGVQQSPGRAYAVAHLPFIIRIGLLSAYLSVAVFGFYIQSFNVQILYSYPQLLWLVCPVLLVWLRRIWNIYLKGKVSMDPVPYVFLDGKNYLFICFFIVVLILAT